MGYTNFLLNIPFAVDCTHMEGLTRTGNDVTWISDGQVSVAPFKGTSSGINFHLPSKRIIFSAIYDWNQRKLVEINTIEANECYVT